MYIVKEASDIKGHKLTTYLQHFVTLPFFGVAPVATFDQSKAHKFTSEREARDAASEFGKHAEVIPV